MIRPPRVAPADGDDEGGVGEGIPLLKEIRCRCGSEDE